MDKQGSNQEEKLAKNTQASKSPDKSLRWIPITAISVVSGIIVIVGTLMALAMYIPSVDNYFDTILMDPKEYYAMTETAHITELFSYSDFILPSSANSSGATGTYGGELSYDGNNYTYKAILSDDDAQINVFDAETHKPDANLWFRDDSMFIRMPEVSDDILKSNDTVGGGMYLDWILTSEQNVITTSEADGTISKYLTKLYENADEVSFERGLKGTLGSKDYKCTAINVTYKNGKAEEIVIGILEDMKTDRTSIKLVSAYYGIHHDEVGAKLDKLISDIKESGEYSGDFTMQVYTDKYGNIIGRRFGKFSTMFLMDEDGTFELSLLITGKDEDQYSLIASGSITPEGKINARGTLTLWASGAKYPFEFELVDFKVSSNDRLLYDGTLKFEKTSLVFGTENGIQKFTLAVEENLKITVIKTSANDKVKIPYSEIYLYETEYEEYLKHANSDALMSLYDKQLGYLF